MIYHLLPGNDSEFSIDRSGALSKDVANMMRFDPSRIVVCQFADNSWGYGLNRIILVPELFLYGKLRGRGLLPRWTTAKFFHYAFRNLLPKIKAGDIIWCHSQPDYFAALADIIHSKGAKLVYHAHSSLKPFYVRSKFRFFNSDAVIFVSDAMRREAMRFLPSLKNTYVIYNGIDESLFYPPKIIKNQNDAEPVILYVGRLCRNKGVHVLLEAMRILQMRQVKVTCKAFGSLHADKSRVSNYMKMLYRTKPSNVSFEGFRSAKEIGNEFRAADIFCCPSIYQEPFGNVNIEAMACGIPVVASQVGGIPEIGSQGGMLLVKPKVQLYSEKINA